MQQQKKPIGIAVEKPYRSVLKAVSWRLSATVDTTIISFIITGSFAWAIKIGLLEICTKMALYYVHERVWSRIKVGLEVQPPDYQI